MRLRSFLAVLIATPAFAGCFDAADPNPSPTPSAYVFVDPMAFGPGHDHRNASQHQFRSNVSLVSHLPLVDQEGETAQSHAIDLCGNWAAVAREFSGTEGVDLVDVSNPQQPVWVGRYRDSDALGGDRNVAWSADCRFVFMANEGSTTKTAGVRVIRAEDKAKPKFESFFSVNPDYRYPIGCVQGVQGEALTCSLPGGVHTVFAVKSGGQQLVFALNLGVLILRLDESTSPARLVYLGKYATATAEQIQAVNRDQLDVTATRRDVMGHDMTVYVEGDKTTMYVAYSYEGLRIVDVTAPSAPVELGKWIPPGPGNPHYVHGVETYFRDGRRFTVVESETFEDRNTNLPSPTWLVDSTNPMDVRLLSTWTNPGGQGADHLLFSAHFMALDGLRLWMAHYHGGVWAIDLTDPTRLVVEGYYLPAEDTAYLPSVNCCSGWKLGGIPMTFDVAVKDGVVWAADFSTGLYGLRLNAN